MNLFTFTQVIDINSVVTGKSYSTVEQITIYKLLYNLKKKKKVKCDPLEVDFKSEDKF